MLQTNSKLIKPGDTFIALRGVLNDGHKYISEAIKNGATKIIAEEGDYDVPTQIVENTHEYLVQELDRLYHDKISKIKLIGVTGTNGKTTICSLCHDYLNKNGKKCGYIGTIGFFINKLRKVLNNTTPDVLDIYYMILECIDEGCQYVVMEVSSHALSYNRIGNLKFDYVIFTNLTEDHLDFHKTMENYVTEKQKLFYKTKKDSIAIINSDDNYFKHFMLGFNKNITYGKESKDYKISNIIMKSSGTIFNLNEETYKMKLIGEYNVYNMCAVIILMKHIFDNKIDVSDLNAPIGRMDTIHYNNFTIIIDYAHTPDAVEKILKNIRNLISGRIVTIIGCGGNRDKIKRPIMGRVASNLSDVCIFTSDNPRNEDPKSIFNDMLGNITLNNVKIIENRKEAIKMGLHICKKNDILLILGKGHENYQIIGNKKYYFNDKEEVEKIIRR